MKPKIRSHLLALMDEIEQKMDATKAIAHDACPGDEAKDYAKRVDEVLEHVENARATLLATSVDGG